MLVMKQALMQRLSTDLCRSALELLLWRLQVPHQWQLLQLWQASTHHKRQASPHRKWQARTHHKSQASTHHKWQARRHHKWQARTHHKWQASTHHKWQANTLQPKLPQLIARPFLGQPAHMVLHSPPGLCPRGRLPPFSCLRCRPP